MRYKFFGMMLAGVLAIVLCFGFGPAKVFAVEDEGLDAGAESGVDSSDGIEEDEVTNPPVEDAEGINPEDPGEDMLDGEEIADEPEDEPTEALSYFGTPIRVYAGDQYSALANEDGSVWAWGLGEPVPALANNSDMILPEPSPLFIFADFELVLREDGTIWMTGSSEFVKPACGENEDPEEGTGFAPVLGLEGVVEVSSSGTHCLALLEDGSVWGWGDNRFFAIGDFPDEIIINPVLIIPGAGGEAGALGGDTTLSLVKGQSYYLPLEGKNILSFEGALITLTYDSNVLRLNNAAAGLPGTYKKVGPAGDKLVIHSIADGEVVFSFKKEIPPGTDWSGLITLLKFESLSDGNTQISVSWAD